jgi:hypothetical protein
MKLRYAIIATVVVGLVGIFLLGNNAKRANLIKSQILAKDEAGEDVEQDIERLARFSARHMNSSVELYLETGYKRATSEAYAAAQPDVNGQVYAEAQSACAGRSDSITQAECVRSYASARLTPAEQKPIVLPDRSRYEFAFKSPIWTPDLAGILLALSAVGLLGIGWMIGIRTRF